MVLFYAPSWWLRIPVICTPFTWDDTMDYIREKLGKKKKVILPQSLRTEAQASGHRSAVRVPEYTELEYTEPDAVQMSMDGAAAEEAAPEESRKPGEGTDPLT